MANTAGEYTISGASIVADGNQMVSNSVKLKYCHKIKAVMEVKTVAVITTLPYILRPVRLYLIRTYLSLQLPAKPMYSNRKHLF